MVLSTSAVPVFAPDPAGRAGETAAAVPDFTVCTISDCRLDSTCGESERAAFTCFMPGTRIGCRNVPDCTVAAIDAMPSGLARTLPWPMNSLAAPAMLPSTGMSVSKFDRPVCQTRPSPNTSLASEGRLFALRTSLPFSMNEVLQELMNASVSVYSGCAPLKSLPMDLPVTMVVSGQGIGVLGVTPASSSAAAVSTFMVEPGAVAPENARFWPVEGEKA